MSFRVIGQLRDVQTIAAGTAIRELSRLRRVYGPGRWLKRKGTALVELPSGETFVAEVHWYEAHGIGRRDMKIKRRLEQP